MDTVSAADAEIVETDPTQSAPTNAGQSQEPAQTVDLSGVVDGLARNDDDIKSVGAELGGKVDGVAGQIEVLRDEVRASNESSSDGQIATVVVDDAQWSEMQQAWWQAKDTIALALFLEIVITLLLAASLGCKMWDIFAKGWRR
jgi:hypothetical protein